MLLPERIKAYLPKKKTQKELDEHYDNVELEKGDIPAMIIAALITFLPVVVLILAAFYGVAWLLFVR